MSIYTSIKEDLRVYVQEPKAEDHLGERKYALKIVEEMEHSRGVAWVGHLTSHGKLVAIVENAGRGGCNDYVVKSKTLWALFCDDAYKAYGNSSESKDALVQLIDIVSNG